MLAVRPILSNLGIDESCVNYKDERPDIRFKYEDKQIGVEVIDCYPSKFDIETEAAVNNLYKEIEGVLTNKGLVGDYHLCLKESIYNTRINRIKEVLISEVESVIRGGDIPTTSYIDSVEKCVTTIHTNKLKIHPYERYMRILLTPLTEDIKRCINKKEVLLSEYKENNPNIDEFWLVIYVPTNENYYSITGIASLDAVSTEYKRIYVSDYLQRARLIYE